MVNAKFAEKGLECRVDHRSYERQGVNELPTVHEGVAVRQMEAKGITTDKGDFNRWVKKANNLLREIRKKITALADWIKSAKAELSKPSQTPDLAALLIAYHDARNAGAWSRNSRISNLKKFSETVNYLTEKHIATLEDLENLIAAQNDKTEALIASMKAKSVRKKELENLLHYAELYQETKPIYDELRDIKWKGKRKKFQAEHERELKTFQMSRRKLEKHFSPASKIPTQKWRQELAALKQEYKIEYERYKPMRDDLMKLLQVKNCVDTVLRQQEQIRQKRREAER